MSDPIKLDRFQRQSLYNQFEILERLTKENYTEQKEILVNGYEIFYGELFVVDDRTVSEHDCRFVLDVLDMFRYIDAYIVHNPDDAEVKDHRRARFSGFDGNHEGELMGFTRFLIATQKKYEESKKGHDGCNSHWPMRETYAAMVRECKQRQQRWTIDPAREDVLAILNAGSSQ